MTSIPPTVSKLIDLEPTTVEESSLIGNLCGGVVVGKDL